MPREPSITHEQVNTAANAIRIAGAGSAARAVRAPLGHDSMNTVLGFLRFWQANVAAQAAMLRPQFGAAVMTILSKVVSQMRADLEAASTCLHQVTTRIAQLENILGDTTNQQAAVNRGV